MFLKPGPTEAVPPDRAQEAREQFIARMGQHFELDGLPRIAGRLMALMILEGQPISFGDLARRLNVSRGSISTNARLLESKGMIERLSHPGERQDYFQLTATPCANLIDGIRERMLRTAEDVETLVAELPSTTDERRRLCRTRDFFTIMADALGEAAERLGRADSEGGTGR
ncbi:GbsR/MarR family transcriptional regulator [Consotaella salsifontis]|nr:MarR family transcriptional regulator [Consotaella salsifontis]